MTQQEFDMACKFANEQLQDHEVAKALDYINNHYPIPIETACKLYDAMEEWCQDNDFAEGEWLEYGDVEDVFLNTI